MRSGDRVPVGAVVAVIINVATMASVVMVVSPVGVAAAGIATVVYSGVGVASAQASGVIADFVAGVVDVAGIAVDVDVSAVV